MSGICGVIRFGGSPVAEQDLDRQLRALAHLGPDAARRWCGGSAGLGALLMRVTQEDLFDQQPLRDGGPDVTAIAVRETIRGLPAGKPLTLSAPVIYAGVPGIADRVKDLEVRDDKGVVPLTLSEDAKVPGGFPNYRHWTAARPTAKSALARPRR